MYMSMGAKLLRAACARGFRLHSRNPTAYLFKNANHWEDPDCKIMLIFVKKKMCCACKSRCLSVLVLSTSPACGDVNVRWGE